MFPNKPGGLLDEVLLHVDILNEEGVQFHVARFNGIKNYFIIKTFRIIQEFKSRCQVSNISNRPSGDNWRKLKQ